MSNPGATYQFARRIGVIVFALVTGVLASTLIRPAAAKDGQAKSETDKPSVAASVGSAKVDAAKRDNIDCTDPYVYCFNADGTPVFPREPKPVGPRDMLLIAVVGDRASMAGQTLRLTADGVVENTVVVFPSATTSASSPAAALASSAAAAATSAKEAAQKAAAAASEAAAAADSAVASSDSIPKVPASASTATSAVKVAAKQAADSASSAAAAASSAAVAVSSAASAVGSVATAVTETTHPGTAGNGETQYEVLASFEFRVPSGMDSFAVHYTRTEGADKIRARADFHFDVALGEHWLEVGLLIPIVAHGNREVRTDPLGNTGLSTLEVHESTRLTLALAVNIFPAGVDNPRHSGLLNVWRLIGIQAGTTLDLTNRSFREYYVGVVVRLMRGFSIGGGFAILPGHFLNPNAQEGVIAPADVSTAYDTKYMARGYFGLTISTEILQTALGAFTKLEQLSSTPQAPGK